MFSSVFTKYIEIGMFGMFTFIRNRQRVSKAVLPFLIPTSNAR